MKPACRDRVATVLGRPVGETEANFIESRIVQSMKTLSRQERASWFALSETERLTRAAAHAADEIVANARAALEAQQTETLDQVKRGDFTIYREGFGQGMAPRIRLFAAADRSTFLHESAHFFLEMLRALAEAPDATASIKSMYADTRNWMGLADGARIEREHHELFARTFEAYLMEGKAPSLKLRKVFAEFARWLKGVYQSLLGLEQQAGEVRLSDDIRSVFDRMLATDQELERARAAMGAGQFTQEQLGLNDADYAAYLDSIETAQEAEETALRAQAIDGYMKQKRAEWKRREAQWRRTKTLEINGQPVYRALEWLARGRWLPGHASPVAESAPEVDGQADTLNQPHQPLPPRLRGEPTTLSRTPPAELPDPGSQEYADMLASARAKEAVYGTPALTELEKRIVRQNRDSEGETFAQFIGVNADTADLIGLDIAVAMLRQGESREKVRQETGWFQDSEAQWQFEISSANWSMDMDAYQMLSAATATQVPSEAEHAIMTGDYEAFLDPASPLGTVQVPLGVILDAPELFSAYPPLRKFKVVLVNMPLGFQGAAIPADPQAGTPGFIILDAHLSSDQLFDTVIHETQHVIQTIEEWHVGGMPQMSMVYYALADDDVKNAAVQRLIDEGKDVNPNTLYTILTGEDQAFTAARRKRMTAVQLRNTAPATSFKVSLPTYKAGPTGFADIQNRYRRKFGVSFTAGPSLAMDPAAPFYSALERTVAESKTTKASAAQWKATLAKTPGLKKEELEWTGVLDWLDGQDAPVTRDALLDFVRANGVRVEETVKGGEGTADEIQQQLLPLIEERDRIIQELSREPEGSDRAEAIVNRLEELYPLIRDLQFNALEQSSGRPGGNTRWFSSTLPGGENYRELLLRLPSVADTAQDAMREKYGINWRRDAPADEVARWDRQHSAEFRSSHWDEPNVFAHVRFKERTDADGKRTLAIEEVQSDWGQTLRKEKEARAKYIDANLDSIVKRMKDAGVLTEVCD